MGSVQHTVQSVVSERIAVAAAAGRPGHGGDVTIESCSTVVVGQALGKVAVGNSRSPSAHVVGIAVTVGGRKRESAPKFVFWHRLF